MWGGEGGSSEPPEPPLDPPLHTDLDISHYNGRHFGTFCVTKFMSEAAIANIKLLSDKMNLLKFQIWYSKNRSIREYLYESFMRNVGSISMLISELFS